MSEPEVPAHRRLHPATLPLRTARWLQPAAPLLLPALVMEDSGFRGAHPDRWLMLALAVVVVAAAVAVVEYLVTGFALGPEALVIRSGLWRRVTRSIPYARIQGVSTSQTLPQRLLGVGTLRVDTGAGGLAAEAQLASLRWGEVQALCEALLRARDEGASAAPPPPAVPLAVLDDEELLVAGATSMQLLVILGAAVGLVERLGDQWVDLLWSDRVRGVASQLPTGGAAGGLLLVLGVVVALSVLAVLWLGIVLVTWLRYRGFRLTRVGGALVREYGWLHRRTVSTPMARVQAVMLRETPPRRMARRVEVRLKSAGAMAVSAPGDEPDVPVLLPIVRAAAAAEAVAHVFPDARADVTAAVPVPGWRRASSLSGGRTGVAWTAVVLAALATLSPVMGSDVWRLLWALPAVWGLAVRAARGRGVGVDGAYLVVREGWLLRTTWVLPVGKLQQVQLRQGPLQRWLGLATVRLTTAGLGGVADAVDLPMAEARLLVDDLVARFPALRRRRMAPPVDLHVPVGADVS